MGNPVVVAAVRTPMGRRSGGLADVHPAELLGAVLIEVLRRGGLDAALVEQVIGGCVTQAGEQAADMVRRSWLHAGLPQHVAGTTVDAQCGSGQQAAHLVNALVKADAIKAGIACGVESMSRIPLGANVPDGLGNPRPDAWTIDMPNQFEAADRIARHRGIGRRDLDAFGLASQQRARAAVDAGRFTDEIVPVHGLGSDEGLRETGPDQLAALRPVLPDGLHTAGTSSQVSDGASAVLIVDEQFARSQGLTPRARIVDSVLVGSDPYFHLDGPADATRALLGRTGRTVADVDLFEVNEAFASVVLSWAQQTGADPARTNVNGGAIALGHPVGSTGTRLITSALHELERRDRETALISMCAGGAMATGTLLARV